MPTVSLTLADLDLCSDACYVLALELECAADPVTSLYIETT